MSYQVRQFTAVIPANTAKASPVTINLATGYWEIDSIDLEVPSGPAGLMGFQLWIGGGQWIPYEAGEYIVWDDITYSWAMSDQPVGQQWSVVGYNTDPVNNHQVTVRFHISQVDQGNTVPAINITTVPTAPLAGSVA